MIGDPEFERILTTPAGDRTEEDNQYFKMRVREKPGQLVVDFTALFEDDDQSQNVRLLPGDLVSIPTKQQTVLVSGRAASPGAVIYNPEFGVFDYIEQVGGAVGGRRRKSASSRRARGRSNVLRTWIASIPVIASG